jgi:hypothetical protein
MSVSMSGKLPSGDGNGLVAVLSELVRETAAQFVTICLVDCKRVTLDKDTGEKIPTVRVRRIEVLLDADDVKIARRLMERALSARTGQETLPYDLAAEIDMAFGSEDVSDYRDEPEMP